MSGLSVERAHIPRNLKFPVRYAVAILAPAHRRVVSEGRNCNAGEIILPDALFVHPVHVCMTAQCNQIGIGREYPGGGSVILPVHLISTYCVARNTMLRIKQRFGRIELQVCQKLL